LQLTEKEVVTPKAEVTGSSSCGGFGDKGVRITGVIYQGECTDPNITPQN